MSFCQAVELALNTIYDKDIKKFHLFQSFFENKSSDSPEKSIPFVFSEISSLLSNSVFIATPLLFLYSERTLFVSVVCS